MGLIDAPDPIAMFEGAKNAGLERDVANAFVSSALSSWICGVWRLGFSRIANWLGIGQALMDSATASYLTLRDLQKKNFLTLTVPSDLLDADNLSRFQTEEKTK
jgi:hypothetical protein